jgi:hypothetical protein
LDGDVETLVNDIGHAQGQCQIDGHRGITLLITHYGRHQVRLAKARHRIHSQMTGRARPNVYRFRLRLIDIGENLPTTLQIALPCLGQRHASGGAVEQSRT